MYVYTQYLYLYFMLKVWMLVLHKIYLYYKSIYKNYIIRL